MDFHLKQWRDQQQQQQQQDESDSVEKFPGGLLHLDQTHHHPPDPSPALSLFSPEPSSTKLTSTNLSAFPPDSSNRLPKMGGGYFSMGQWQELELQALIYRHMLTGTAIPPELLHLLLKKSLINSPSPYYQLPHPLQQYPHFQPSLLQAGYWGRGAMDPEPGRCRRTDGKKWRCSRDIVAGHKYCERHIHRGRNRSRKPVEIPTPASTTTTTNVPISGHGGGSSAGGNGGGGVLKTTNINPSVGGSNHPFSALTGGGNQFGLNGHSPSFDLQHLSQRNSESMIENKSIYRSHSEMSEDDKSGGRILRHFFDDWPRSIHEPENTSSNSSSFTSTTSLSISVPENPSSDFSLRLSTGNGDVAGAQEGNVGRERPLLDWGMAWGSNPAASMGGPLAEALRSSTSNSSPTSVLHQLQRGGSTPDASYIST